MTSEKKVILCADDFGISPSVSKSICALAERKKISATSVMVVHKDWDIYCRSLVAHKAHLDIGLHFVLTEARPHLSSEKILSLVGEDGEFLGMSQFMRRAWLRQVKGNEVILELAAQYDKFVKNFGFEPDFIDGHHNIHQYPVVGDEVIRFVKEKNLEGRIYIRNTAHQWAAILKGPNILKTVIISIPGVLFKKKLLSGGLRTNESFGGTYNLNHSGGFERQIKKFFIYAHANNAIVMVHPGKADASLAQRDSFCEGREIEEQVLLQDSFQKFLRTYRISLSKFE